MLNIGDINCHFDPPVAPPPTLCEREPTMLVASKQRPCHLHPIVEPAPLEYLDKCPVNPSWVYSGKRVARVGRTGLHNVTAVQSVASTNQPHCGVPTSVGDCLSF